MTLQEFNELQQAFASGAKTRHTAEGRGPGLNFLCVEENGFTECSAPGCEHYGCFKEPARLCGLHMAELLYPGCTRS